MMKKYILISLTTFLCNLSFGQANIVSSLVHQTYQRNFIIHTPTGFTNSTPVPIVLMPVSYTHLDVYKRQIIGNGVVIDPVVFKSEIDGLAKFNLDIKSKLIISRKAHLILPTHRLLDAASEASKGKAKIGSTLKGIGPTYMDKTCLLYTSRCV